MEDPRWDRLEVLFAEAVDLPGAERAAYLDEACAGEPALRLQVEALVAASHEASGMLGDVVGSVAREAVAAARAGQRLGAYEVVRELGRGGMGTVFLARRADQEYEAEVAIKLIRGLHTADHLRRFRVERQILARLRHPNIAHLIDGGTTPDGVPYVVMEYVDGVPLDRYCNEHRLSVDERLELFSTVCGAVQFAHRNLIVHCDLKPGNILVSREGVPKLLDFGIARLIEPGDPGDATMTAARLGTPAYASPEQITGSPVSIATDVHALGVILYELLTGQLPFSSGTRSAHDLERLILESDPTPASVAAARGGELRTAAELAAERATDPVRLSQRLRGDLDAVTLTVLHSEAARRYPSVDDLVEDLARHRAGLPVAARSGGKFYRAGKFVRRHRFGVGVATAAILLLTTFAATVSVQAGRLARERDAATLARREAEEVSSFLIDLFRVPDPSESRGNEVTAREVLDLGATSISGRLGEQPATRAAMMDVIGRVYENLGLVRQAQPLIDSALALRRGTFGEEHVAVAASLHSVAELQATLGRYDSARVIYRDALEMRRRLLSRDDPALAETLDALATLESDAGNYDEAERLYREALAIDSAAFGPGHPNVVTALASLGTLLRRKGDYAAAEPLIRDGLAFRRRLYGTDHPEVGESLNQLARLLALQGRAAEAEPVVREELAVHRKVFGERSIEAAYSLGNLSGILNDLGDSDGALAARRESLSIVRELYGDQHPLTAAALQSLAAGHYGQGALDSARVNYEYAIQLQRGLLGPDDPNLGFALTGLGRVLIDLGRPAEAEPLLLSALELRRGGLPADHWFIAATELALGECLSQLGRHAEAERLVTNALAVLERTFGSDDSRTVEAREMLASVQTGRERP